MTHLPLAALALSLAATSALSQTVIDRTRPDAPALAAFGTFAVGVREVALTNPGQINVVSATAEELPRLDRQITVEIWYPATPGAEPGTAYRTLLRDGTTPVALVGRATRDAAPSTDGPFPLVLLSHGYPGNRFLMSHFGENLASKGYVVAAIDHPDSTYDDLGAFGSTLYNRPLDQKFVLEQMAGIAAIAPDLGGVVDADHAAVIGYSMGGYGALVFGGAGLAPAALAMEGVPPQDLLAQHRTGSETLNALPDPRVKAIIAIGPWGINRGLWDAEGLAGITAPLMIMAGSADQVSDYGAIRQIFAGSTGTSRHLLTFQNAGHNAAAPIPAPLEGWKVSETLGWAPFAHYADPVWDSVRMNNIAQHFATAFLDLHLKGKTEAAPYLDLIPDAAAGVWSVAEDGTEQPDHSYWKGFAEGTAIGLMFETQMPQ